MIIIESEMEAERLTEGHFLNRKIEKKFLGGAYSVRIPDLMTFIYNAHKRRKKHIYMVIYSNNKAPMAHVVSVVYL